MARNLEAASDPTLPRCAGCGCRCVTWYCDDCAPPALDRQLSTRDQIDHAPQRWNGRRFVACAPFSRR